MSASRAASRRMRGPLPPISSGGPGRCAGRNRGHARVEYGRATGAALERHELILEDLGVRVREPRVDEVDVLILGGRDLAERDCERSLGSLRAREHERRSAVDGRPCCAHGEAGIEATRENRGLGADAIRRLRHHARLSARAGAGQRANEQGQRRFRTPRRLVRDGAPRWCLRVPLARGPRVGCIVEDLAAPLVAIESCAGPAQAVASRTSSSRRAEHSLNPQPLRPPDPRSRRHV